MTAQETQHPATQKKASRALPVVVGLVLLILVTRALLSSGRDRPQIGDPAPDFTLATFNGSAISLGDLRGQVLVLNFWASWCSPCRQEASELQKVWESYKDKNVAFLGVTFQDAENASQDFIREFGITYSNGIDQRGRLRRAYGVTAVPETFLIDQEGKVVWFHAGAVSADALAEQLSQLAGTN